VDNLTILSAGLINDRISDDIASELKRTIARMATGVDQVPSSVSSFFDGASTWERNTDGGFTMILQVLSSQYPEVIGLSIKTLEGITGPSWLKEFPRVLKRSHSTQEYSPCLRRISSG
jgi:predicted Rdx family selenoprotein